MKKLVLSLFLTIIFINISFLEIYSQDNNSNEKKAQPYEITGKLPKPLMRIYEFNRKRAYPNKEIPDGARINAIKQMEQMMYDKNSSNLTLAQQPEWLPIGPFDVGGRIKSVAPHPTQSGTVYVGAAAGGIWKTTNGGTRWDPVFDYENGIAFGSIAIDPNNPNVIYAGTGEAVSSVGGVGGTPIYLGDGVYKSTDAGASWKQIGLTNVGTFSKVWVHPKNSNLIVAGGAYKGPGFYRSTDAGNSWEKTFDKNVTDVTIDPTDESNIIIGVLGDGTYFSSDTGKTFVLRASGLDVGIGRVSVQMAPTKPNIAYALIDISGRGTLYKTTNYGTSWSLSYQGPTSFFSDQGWYDNYITVNPTDENTVLAGGIDIWRTTNGGTSWDNVTNGYSGGNVHPDQHHAAFDPLDPNNIYAGNDGGMYKSTDGGYSWKAINNNLQVTQFYSLAIDNSQENRNYGGTQDNGTVGNIVPASWSGIFGGDGFRVIVDRDNPNIVYGESQFGSLMRLDISTSQRRSITNGIPSSDTGLFDSPFIMSPSNNTILLHGRHAIYVSIDNGESWSELFSKRSSHFTSLAMSPINESIIWGGNEIGELYVTQDQGANGESSWKEVSKNGLVNRFLMDIEPSYKNECTAFVTFSGYGTPHVFKTTNCGASWTNIGVNLPDVPVNAIAIHPDNEDYLFVATDVGVFATYDGGQNWLPFGRNLPRSPVHDISFHKNRVVLPNLTLRVATHGRSMWEVEIPADQVTDPAITCPAGGESYVAGSSAIISWYGFDKPVKIDFSKDDGMTWDYTIANNVQGNYLRWTIPWKTSEHCRIRITPVITDLSKNQILSPNVFVISRAFTINELRKGSVLNTSGVKFVPYGLAYDGNGGLWATSFYENRLYKLNCDNFSIDRFITLPGDSLFTDLTYDKVNNIMYVHHMANSSGLGGGTIIKVDTSGNKLKEFKSPAKNYPTGLELVDGKLLVGDRDGSHQLYLVDPATGSTLSQCQNPYNKTYGPRSLCYDGISFIYQACTEFPNAGALSEAVAIRIDKADLTTEKDRMALESNTGGMINARGIEYDPRDKNFWVSDFGGNLFKIAGFDAFMSVQDDFINSNFVDAIISPNPIHDFGTVTFKLLADNSNIKVQIYNILGEFVGTYFDKILNKDESSYFQFKADNLSSGIYSVVFYLNGKIILTKKIMVVK